MNALLKVTKTDYSLISDLVKPGSSVLDLGCGDGELLRMLIDAKKVKGRGVDIDENNVIACIEKGLSVCQSDIDAGLKDFQDKSFDCVVLNQTIQVLQKPHVVIDEMLRVGRKAIVGFPNFSYLGLLTYLFLHGRMPKSKTLPFSWYDTPNIHLLTVQDFRDYCRDSGLVIEQEICLRGAKVRKAWPCLRWIENFFVEAAVFVISRD